ADERRASSQRPDRISHVLTKLFEPDRSNLICHVARRYGPRAELVRERGYRSLGGGSMWMMASAICGNSSIRRSLTMWDRRWASRSELSPRHQRWRSRNVWSSE